MNTTSERKVQLEDLKKGGEEIQTSTRWNRKLTAFAKVVEVNDHEVQVEEKRKQTDEVGSSQRLETSE